jgi:hypothetical protein
VSSGASRIADRVIRAVACRTPGAEITRHGVVHIIHSSSREAKILVRGPGEVEIPPPGVGTAVVDGRGDIRERPPTDEVAFSPILARLSLLLTAMFNLTGMVEDLLLVSGKPRKLLSEKFGIGDALPGFSEKIPPARYAASAPVQGSVVQPPAVRSTDFGSLGRRRRRGILAIRAALLFLACLAGVTLALIGAGNTESPVPRVAETADEPPATRRRRQGRAQRAA